ncbi:TonB-dependent receptor plug domain-containing protein, partial [Gammaproteobacteria bacterium]|nr:TonB-dependent receptor plug domain-containing protein [Gammaproteobacteria bacterium]
MTLSEGLLSSKSAVAVKGMAYLVWCLFFVIFAHSVKAQDNVGDESTIRYPAEYFVDFNPMTAQDMVYRIPGVQTSSRSRSGGGGGGRGFGSGGSSEIIINGKRAAGKSNATGQQLQRITAQQVNYIEIIRGTSGELDVRGSGQIVNVVLFEELSSTSVNYEINMESYADQERKPGGSVALSGKAGQLGFVLSGEIDPRYENQTMKEHSVLADYSDNDYIREDRIRDQTNYNLSANLDYEINDFSSARFNALYREDDNPTEIFRTITSVRSDPSVLTAQREDQGGERNNWEVGGDYELNRSNGDRLKFLFIANQRNDHQIR